MQTYVQQFQQFPIEQAVGVVQNLDTFFAGQGTLGKNISHLRPISSHVFSGVRFIGVAMTQAASTKRWHGRCVKFLAKCLVAIGYILNSLIGLVEAAVTIPIGLIATAIHLLTGAKNEFLQKYTAKCLSYGLNSLLTVIQQVFFLYRRDFPEYHTFTKLLSHGTYLASALFVQLTFGRVSDSIANRKHPTCPTMPLAAPRMVRLLMENGESALRDIVNAAARDFCFSTRSIPSIRDALERNPQYRELFSNFSFRNIQDEQYRARFAAFFIDIMRQASLVRIAGVDADVGAPADNPLEVILNNHRPEDVAYQNVIAGHVKDAVAQLYGDEKLTAYLNVEGDVKAAKEALENFYAESCIPLAHLAQLGELESENACPEAFGNRELHIYNFRHEKLETTRAKLKNLNPSDRELLIEHLIKGGSFNFNDRSSSKDSEILIQELFVAISELAGPLHQGKLMSQLTMNVGVLQASSNNLFIKAYKEAMDAILK